jgi:exo-beta-1,3-glucanase (GH17 family)
MRLLPILFAPVALAIACFWWWLGAPIAMPPSPLAAGEKLYCVSYAPFRDQQSPLDPDLVIPPEQIEDDFARLAKLTDCVRTYSTEQGLDRVPEIAARHGMKVLLGVWLGGEPEKNKIEIDKAVALAASHPTTLRGIVMGNEVLLRGEMAATDLAALIRGIKQRVSVPVTYADVWEYWLRYRDIYEAVDFVTIHILPYWEDFPIGAQEAAAHVDAIRQRVATVFPNKEILIGETGWPSAGRMREAARPSPANQAFVIHEVLAAAKRGDYRVNVIEAFDQPWKRRFEGTVGGHWGFLDAKTRDFKFSWGEALSNHPHWPWQAAAGIALAAAVFAAGYRAAARRGGNPGPRIAGGIAVAALAAGLTIGWALENIPLESLTVGDWTRSIAMSALGIAVPILVAVALAEDKTVRSFAAVLNRNGGDVPAVSRWLTLALIVTTALAIHVALGLSFDPRYKDFPFAPMTAAIVPFGVLALAGKATAGDRGPAETAAAIVLLLSVGYFVPNESLANWQSLWLAATFVVLAFTLLRVRDARS